MPFYNSILPLCKKRHVLAIRILYPRSRYGSPPCRFGSQIRRVVIVRFWLFTLTIYSTFCSSVLVEEHTCEQCTYIFVQPSMCSKQYSAAFIWRSSILSATMFTSWFCILSMKYVFFMLFLFLVVVIPFRAVIYITDVLMVLVAQPSGLILTRQRPSLLSCAFANFLVVCHCCVLFTC